MTREVILFPDTVALLIDYLRDQLDIRADSAEVVPRIPNPRPQRCVLVRRVGGVVRNEVTDQASITVETWDITDEDAHDLAQTCRGLLRSLVGVTLDGVAVYRVDEFAGPAFLPDELSNTPRYSQTISVAVRGVAESGS